MIQQVAIGAVLIVATVVIHAFATRAAIQFTVRVRTPSRGLPGAWSVTWLTAAVAVTMFLAAMLEALIWAWTYIAVGAFEGLEPAAYFSLVTFTTLGFGDVVLDPSWRLLSAIEAANGIMIFGWTTALIFWVLQRSVQRILHQHGIASSTDGVTSELMPSRRRDEP